MLDEKATVVVEYGDITRLAGLAMQIADRAHRRLADSGIFRNL